MRRLVRKTIIGLLCAVIVLATALVAGLSWVSYTFGSVEGYTLGLHKAEMTSPFRSHVERGMPFVYDGGVIHAAKRVNGKRAPYYIIQGGN